MQPAGTMEERTHQHGLGMAMENFPNNITTLPTKWNPMVIIRPDAPLTHANTISDTRPPRLRSTNNCSPSYDRSTATEQTPGPKTALERAGTDPPATPQQFHLYHKLVTPTEPWEKKLWHTIQPYQELDQLATDLTRGIPIILSTDAAMNAAKRSCFAWTIYSTTDLWKGSGAVPGPYEDAHSTRSEAYGILTMLRFLLQYVSHFPMVLTRAHPIQLYCDNNGIL